MVPDVHGLGLVLAPAVSWLIMRRDDAWPYELRNRTGYRSTLTTDEIEKNLVKRPVTYRLGETDILPLGVFDVSCPAMAQGPTVGKRTGVRPVCERNPRREARDGRRAFLRP
jgi:hypothetical protein